LSRSQRIGVPLFLLLLIALAFYLFRTELNAGLSRWFETQEVRFDVPEKPLQLDANVTVAKDRIQICNRGAFPWSSVTLRATSRALASGLPPDLPLLGQVTKVNAGKCVDVPNSELFSPGWKRIPAPSEVNIVRVEILASITGPGYFVKTENPTSGAVR
jgi:hypothetical protein